MTKLPRILHILTLPCLVAPLVGCDDTPEVPTGVSHQAQIVSSYTDPTSSLTFGVGTRSASGAACPDTRLIGQMQSPGQCPAAASSSLGDWNRAHLFAGSSGVPTGELGRFCVYTWAPHVPGNAPDTGALPTDGQDLWSDWLSADCNVVSAMASGYGATIAAELESAFTAQAQRVDPVTAPIAPPTTVFVVDSAIDSPQPFPGSGRLDHGHAMGMMIRRLTCAAPPATTGCLSAVASSLALTLRYTVSGELVRDHAVGGYFGSLTDLAIAIYEAVERAGALSSDRGVINLSVGWDPEWGGHYTGTAHDTLAPPVRAVQRALTYARCEGVLVLAAAGNDSGGPLLSSGPMLPAAWENKPRPNAAECLALGSSGPPSSTSSYQPLVYAVSGVDGADQPLANTRPNGRARLAAPGAHAMLTNAVTGTATLTEAYTGSSVASAVASAAVAAAWTSRPNLSGPDVVDIVYHSAVDLGHTSDFCLGSTCSNQKRVSICRTLAAACLGNPGCVSPTCVPAPAFRDDRPAPASPSPLSATETVSAAHLTASATMGAPCNGTLMSAPGTAGLEPCPSRQFYGYAAEPWVQPQPGGTPCPTCLVDFDGSLWLALEDKLQGVLSDPTLNVWDAYGGKTIFALDIDADQMMPGAMIQVTDLGLVTEDIEVATIDFMIDGIYSTSDELMVNR